ncbi:hypothetical protein EMCRGX_G004772 [Ephydatia muelleri]
MLPASVWFVHDRVDGLELGPDVLVVDGLELVNELELGPDVLAVDGLELELEETGSVLRCDFAACASSGSLSTTRNQILRT